MRARRGQHRPAGTEDVVTRYQQGYNPFTGGVSLPDSDAVETAKSQLVANSQKVTPAQPFPRVFDLWSTALKLAAAEDLDPTEATSQDRRRFHDNIGALISGDVPLMALIATMAVRYETHYEGKVFEEAIQVLDDPSSQVKIADLYAHVGALRLLEIIDVQRSAPGPALTRHFQKVAQPVELGPEA